MNPDSVTEREHNDKFADRYVLGEGYPEHYYDNVGLRNSMDFMISKKIFWPKELKDRKRPKYRLVLERVEKEK